VGLSLICHKTTEAVSILNCGVFVSENPECIKSLSHYSISGIRFGIPIGKIEPIFMASLEMETCSWQALLAVVNRRHFEQKGK
jgi:hypothetical protein